MINLYQRTANQIKKKKEKKENDGRVRGIKSQFWNLATCTTTLKQKNKVKEEKKKVYLK